MKNLFKYIVAMTFCFVFLSAGTADAKLGVEQVAIGGITYKMPISQVIEMYGNPHRIESGSVYCWGANSLRVNTYSPKGPTDYVTEVKVAERNGMETPDGVIVGMPESVLDEVYGPADRVDYDRNGCTVYIYGSKTSSLAFRTKQGKIQVIELAAFFS